MTKTRPLAEAAKAAMAAKAAKVAESADLAGSALGVLLGSGVAIGSALGIRILMARSLRADDLGAVLLAIAVASFLGMVASLGLRQASARRIASLLAITDSEGARRTARTALVVAGCGGLVAAALVLLGPRWNSLLGADGTVGIAAIPFLVSLGTAPASLGLALGVATWGISQGHGDTRGRALFRDAGGSLLRLVGVLAAALVSEGPALFAFGWGFGSFLGEMSFVAYGRRRGWFGATLEAKKIDATLIRSLPPFAGTTFVNQLATWLDVVLLGALAPLAVVGVYGAAQGLGRVLGQISDSAAHRFLGVASTAVAAGDDKKLVDSYVEARRLALSYLWPALAPCLLAPEAVATLLFGAHYEAAGLALRGLAAGWLLRAFSGYTEEVLFARGRAAWVFGLVLSTSLVIAALFALAVPRGGAAAAVLAAWAVAGGQALRGGLGLALLGRPIQRAALAPRSLIRLAVPLIPAVAVAWGFQLWSVAPAIEVAGVVLAALLAAIPTVRSLRSVVSRNWSARRRAGALPR